MRVRVEIQPENAFIRKIIQWEKQRNNLNLIQDQCREFLTFLLKQRRQNVDNV